MRIVALLMLAWSASAATGETLTIAVASNFHGTAQGLAAEFTADTGIAVRLSSGSTGKLYAQIVNGAPYDLFLAADMLRPQRLLQDGLGVEGSLRAYVRGTLLLVSADPELSGDACLTVLKSGAYRKLAIANPATAPYGAAARAWLQSEGLWDDARARIVMGENVIQAYQFVATGNATLALVSASQLAAGARHVELGCQLAVDIPDRDMLQQGALVLRRTAMLDEARLFMRFLASDAALGLMQSAGYTAATD